MNKLKSFLTIILVALFFSCSEAPVVTFNAPQPANTSNLSEFPERLQGQYVSLDDQSVLTIDKNLIQRTYDDETKLHPNQLDSTSRLSGDTLIDLTTNETKQIKRDGDSLVIHTHYRDTLFELNYDNVVRKFKGYYFINKRHDKESWEVKKLELSKGQLIISSISSEQDIETLKTITESSQDTVAPYKFSPTKKQFRTFLKSEGFSDSETFIKQKKEL